MSGQGKGSGTLAPLSVLWKAFVSANGFLTTLSYPVGAVFMTTNRWPATVKNARLFWQFCLGVWLIGAGSFYYGMWHCTWALQWRLGTHLLWFYAWDWPIVWFAVLSFLTERTLGRKECTNRLFNREAGTEKFKGSKIVVLGNGPSLASGDPLGAAIDSMDEVVRFNNFQTKTSGLEAWTGTRTTVHFSDSMLYPSFPEYRVPGACLCLSLFMDRLMIAGSYFLFRIAIDLAIPEALGLMSDPELGWLSAEDIENMKQALGISRWKHPTSGIMAIDWMVRHRPDPKVPIYVHGFDFFLGPKVHYYSQTEPIYERINDLVGVFMMHEPHKERAFVEGLVKEGKVKWLKDMVADGDAGAKVTAAVSAAKDAASKVDASDGKASPKEAAVEDPLLTRLWTCVSQANRALTVLSYPLCLPFITMNFAPTSFENARVQGLAIFGVWSVATYAVHAYLHLAVARLLPRLLGHFLWFFAVDAPCFWAVVSFAGVAYLMRRSHCTNRLFGNAPPRFHGSRIVVLGNGPSMAKGEPHGALIDSLDEVVRFNNFQTKTSGLERWTGSKVTVHFSDSMLYPSYREYRVPGACVCLSLFADRLMISISYFIFRMGIDLAPLQAWDLMSSPDLGWLPTKDIEEMKRAIGIAHWKHPTSGALAIDWFVRHRPDPKVPVYIHGFDFFQGDQVHYYTRTEPLYERLNDLAGVNLMHEPGKERAWVDRLVQEGKVKWLSDLAKEGGGRAS